MAKHPNDKTETREGLDYVQKVRANTRRYVDDIRSENERLRLLTSSLESERLLLENRLVATQSELDLQVGERNKLLERIQEVEDEQESWARDHSDIEEQNNNLASLYVATYGLHGTLDQSEVIRAIKEIVANLIGSEEMAIFEFSRDAESLELLASQGIELDSYRSLAKDDGLIWNAITTGQTYAAGHTGNDASATPTETTLTACIPLKIDGEVIGAIAVFRLLGHKAGLEPLDFELFDLLGSQAAIALQCTKLHSLFSEELRAGVR